MTEIKHKDLLNRDISVGNFVAVPFSTSELQVCTVTKLTPKRVRVKRINHVSGGWWDTGEKLAHPGGLIKLPECKELTMLILKTSKNT